MVLGGWAFSYGQGTRVGPYAMAYRRVLRITRIRLRTRSSHHSGPPDLPPEPGEKVSLQSGSESPFSWKIIEMTFQVFDLFAPPLRAGESEPTEASVESLPAVKVDAEVRELTRCCFVPRWGERILLFFVY